MNFLELLASAIAHFTEHGFADPHILDLWLKRLQKAAEEQLPSEKVTHQHLKRSLEASFERVLTPTAIKRRHPDASRFTIQHLKPQLRDELSRRIVASANLIKLNREQMVDRTLQRFSGWASSIPEGGSRVVDKREVKADITKALRRVTFEERRVAIDQGHKLMASIDAVIAADTKAIAGMWRSHWRQAGYDYRPDHKERDQKVYAMRGSWAMEKGLLHKGAGYLDEMTGAGEEVFCFPGDSVVPFADGVEIAYRRWYVGELIEVVTASGETLRGTPNHPVLTSHGWKALGILNKGDDVIKRVGEVINTLVSAKDKDDAVPTIAKVFGSLAESGVPEVRSGQSKQFHGDGRTGNVDIVRAARPLQFCKHTALDKGFQDFAFTHSGNTRPRGGPFDFFSHRGLSSFACLISSLSAGGMLFRRLVGCYEYVRLLLTPRLNAYAADGFDNASSGYSTFLGKRKNAFPGKMVFRKASAIKGCNPIYVGEISPLDESRIPSIVEGCNGDAKAVSDFMEALPFAAQTDNVVSVNRVDFAGHVYNLQTRMGWYVTNNIITHNCRCYVVYYTNLRDLPDDMLTEKGRKLLSETRVRAA